jgi:hypothetical protein
MEQAQSPRFFKALAEMGLMFGDELTKPRQLLYWELFRDKITIEEWEFATSQAMTKETFHKVPLPAALMEYVREHRRQQRAKILEEQCHEHTASRQRLLEIREKQVDTGEIERLIASVFPEYPREEAERLLAREFPRRRVRLSEEELQYEPQTDPEIAKRKAREYLEHLRNEEVAP